jgi:hypothetical protein
MNDRRFLNSMFGVAVRRALLDLPDMSTSASISTCHCPTRTEDKNGPVTRPIMSKIPQYCGTSGLEFLLCRANQDQRPEPLV